MTAFKTKHARAGKEAAVQFLAASGFAYAATLLEDRPRQLLLALGFLLAKTDFFEAATALDRQQHEIPDAQLPYNCLRQCWPQHSADTPLQASTQLSQLDDNELWNAVSIASHRAQRLHRCHDMLQRQLRSACVANIRLAAQLHDLQVPHTGQAAHLSPYEASVAARDAAFRAHMQGTEQQAAQMQRQIDATAAGVTFFAWLDQVRVHEEAAVHSQPPAQQGPPSMPGDGCQLMVPLGSMLRPEHDWAEVRPMCMSAPSRSEHCASDCGSIADSGAQLACTTLTALDKPRTLISWLLSSQALEAADVRSTRAVRSLQANILSAADMRHNLGTHRKQLAEEAQVPLPLSLQDIKGTIAAQVRATFRAVAYAYSAECQCLLYNPFTGSLDAA